MSYMGLGLGCDRLRLGCVGLGLSCDGFNCCKLVSGHFKLAFGCDVLGLVYTHLRVNCI